MSDDPLAAILSLPRKARDAVTAQMSDEQLAWLHAALQAEVENPWGRWVDDPVAFVEDPAALNEPMWSLQREVALALVDHKRVAVPAAHAVGKSHLASRIVAWWISAHPPGTAFAVTVAPTHRQVRAILWPHLRRVATLHNLPGEVLTVTWKVDDTLVAQGFSPAAWDETAVQGIHAPHLLIVVDEAGGISDVVGGALESLMTGGHTRLLLIGNPPTDKVDGWFERACSSPLYHVRPIPATASPNLTGEPVGNCHTCPPWVEAHSLATHLVDQSWIDDVIQEFGEESAFVEARVHARFPRVATDAAIPYAWVEDAMENDAPDPGTEIALGVDVAADGGDEFAICRRDGWTARIIHRSSGSANSNAVDVAGVVLEAIKDACGDAQRAGQKRKVKVKIDSIGVGWGVTSTLQRWVGEHMLAAEIVPVNVSEAARDTSKFRNKRAEMWWTGRQLLQTVEGRQQVRLEIDRPTAAQLATPKYQHDSAGRIQIEGKPQIKKRGLRSPDRAEAILLAFYDPHPSFEGVSPVNLPQAGFLGEWSAR